ncbi:unnamed protein product [Pedinophyceae sp. YPF-701]|nr:unnamed protein product [Pedinophyceae sp. YPF-701]
MPGRFVETSPTDPTHEGASPRRSSSAATASSTRGSSRQTDFLSPSEADATDSNRDRAFAYATLLTRDGYLPGALCLQRSLRLARCQHPLLVLHTDTLSDAAVRQLEQEGCKMVRVDRYLPADMDPSQYKLSLYAECWTKLRLWDLEQYSRIVYLDADMAVTRNIDELFDLPPGFYAVPDCSYGRQSQEERDKCPLFHADAAGAYFNAGMFVMAPSRAEAARFERLLRSGEVRVGGFAEQDFLNEIYAGEWRALPVAFNAQKFIRMHHPDLFDVDSVAIIHYTDAKPWHREHPEHENFQDIVNLWWSIYEAGNADRMHAAAAGGAKAAGGRVDGAGAAIEPAALASTGTVGRAISQAKRAQVLAVPQRAASACRVMVSPSA